MATIRLSWTDLNSGSISETGFNIYRDTTEIDEDNLPTVFATVDADVTTYDDDTAVDNTTYYYAVEAVSDDASAVSSVVSITVGEDLVASVEGIYTVTVPSGKVASDLTDFPLMIDLSDMPESFWTNVQDDGGNVRAYEDDGVTLVPHDLTFINTTLKHGRMFVKKTLLAASATTVKVATVEGTVSKLLDENPNGRNAVWADYEVVYVFPETENRTGKEYTQDMSNVEDPSTWVRSAYDASLAGNPHQGIATDGNGVFITIDTDYLRAYANGIDGALTASNDTPLADTGIADVDHIGDGCIVGTELFVPVEVYPATAYDTQYICVFDVTDLSFLRSYDISAQAHEVSSIAHNDGFLYVTDYTVDDYIYKYTTAGVYVSTITLTTGISEMQGIEYVDGVFYITNGDSDVYEVALDGTVAGVILHNYHNGQGEGLCYDGTNLYLMDEDGDLSTWVIDKHSDYGRLHYVSTTVELPASTVWTAAASLYMTQSDAQTAFLDLSNGNTNSDRTSLMYDEGPDHFDVYNQSDDWIDPPIEVNPSAYEDHQVAFAYNGTTNRKIVINGVLGEEETGNSAYPAGSPTDMQFNINGSRPSGQVSGEAYYQNVWLRTEYMDDVWLKADYDNNQTPSLFYDTITEDAT